MSVDEKKLTIGCVSPYSFAHPGGVQNHILGLGHWLSCQGHRVYYLAPDGDQRRWTSSYSIDDFVQSSGRSIRISANGSSAFLSWGRGVSRRVKSWLSDHHFDLIHIHEPFVPSVSWHALRLSPYPVVGTFHIGYRSPIPSTIARTFLRTCGWIRPLNAAIAVSPVAQMTAYSYSGIQAQIIPNGIEADLYGLDDGDREVDDLHNGYRYVIFVGRLDDRRKGFDILWRAWPQVIKHCPNAHLIIIGETRKRSRLEKMDSVTFLGAVDDRTRNEWLSRSDVFVAPHRGGESFGIVLLEALLSSTTPVASDIEAFRFLLDGGRIGRLVRPEDSQALAWGIIQALHTSCDRKILHDYGRRYDWSQVGSQILNIYRDVLSKKGSSSARRSVLSFKIH